ncbi:phosphoglycerate dehydrogenase, partial [Glaciimonas sp. CA11.2]|nr:phosphoglycerate dehydrogenase [Glaciimonas sp. CA11.2]
VLSAINRIFSENGFNIAAQSLMTNDALGYLVMDVDADYSTVALHKLQEVEGTIWARVLY